VLAPDAPAKAPKAVPSAPVVPVGAERSRRPWDNPFADARDIPWHKRRYLFNWSTGFVTVAPLGDGFASNGGWRIDKKHDHRGRVKAVDVASEGPNGGDVEEAYRAQNRIGYPFLTYEEVDRVYALSEKKAVPLWRAFFEICDTSNLTANAKKAILGTRDVYADSRKQSEDDGGRGDLAEQRAAELAASGVAT